MITRVAGKELEFGKRPLPTPLAQQLEPCFFLGHFYWEIDSVEILCVTGARDEGTFLHHGRGKSLSSSGSGESGEGRRARALVPTRVAAELT